VPENNARFDEPTPVVRRAIALLDSTFEALATRERWCKGAFAKDAEGDPIEGRIVEAVESPEVASRCAFAELLHQGLASGFRIEIATMSDRWEQLAAEVTRAPASWMLAGEALALAAVAAIEERGLGTVHLKLEQELRSRPLRVGQVVLTSIHINDRGTYEDAVWTVALATKLLRAELARRAAAETAS
jgi:hypothetical protein